MSVERFDASGNVSFGAGSATTEGSRYRVTIDFVSADTVSVPLRIRKLAELAATGKFETVSINAPFTAKYVPGSERYEVHREDPVTAEAKVASPEAKEYDEVWLPTYVGVGLRVTARVTVLKAGADISGLGAIGVAAEASYLSGDLVVQTLGINGQEVTAALPIQSDLNQTTVMNAVVSVSSIKTLLYGTKTQTFPRLVGLYLPFAADQKLVNAIISALSRERVTWFQSCVVPRQ
jgi:hypothetical protein